MNMSYCKWQNTEVALRQCCDDLTEKIEGDEAEARRKVIRLAMWMLDELGLDHDITERQMLEAIHRYEGVEDEE